MDFGWRFFFFFISVPLLPFSFLLNQCHLDRIWRPVSWNPFFPSSSLSLQHFHFVCHAKVSFNKKAPILGRKRNTSWLQVHRWTWGKWKVIETTQVHQCAGGEMRLKLDFSGAGRQIVWIIQEGERTEVGSSDLKLMQRNESSFLILYAGSLSGWKKSVKTGFSYEIHNRISNVPLIYKLQSWRASIMLSSWSHQVSGHEVGEILQPAACARLDLWRQPPAQHPPLLHRNSTVCN